MNKFFIVQKTSGSLPDHVADHVAATMVGEACGWNLWVDSDNVVLVKTGADLAGHGVEEVTREQAINLYVDMPHIPGALEELER